MEENNKGSIKTIYMHVGQKLWLVLSSPYANDSREPKEVTVSKVGKKYFELEEYPHKRYHINTMREDSELSYKGQCHLTLQEILDNRELERLKSKLRQVFSNYSPISLTLHQMQSIEQIVDGKSG